MDAQVLLLANNQQRVVDTIEVPAHDNGWPIPGVVIHKGRYFVGPSLEEHAAVPTYVHVESFVAKPTSKTEDK